MDEFIQSVADSLKAVEHFLIYFRDAVVASGQQGSCSNYNAASDGWVNPPGFTDVPDQWYPLYYEQRSALDSVGVATMPISQVCAVGGGNIPDETDQAIIAALDSALNRLGTVLAQAQALR